MVYDLIPRKTFDDARYQKKWRLIVDRSQLYSGSRQINEQCLEKHYNKGTEKEKVNYHSDVLEAKIVLVEKLVISIASEFIENNGEDALRQKSMSEEQHKQDCETKAFKRFAIKLKKRFPHLPIIFLEDSLYASETVVKICRKNHWDFIVRYKSGSIPSIAAEYEAIPEKGTVDQAEYVNEIDYKGKPVNMLRYWEEKVIKGKDMRTEFQWLISIKDYRQKCGEAGTWQLPEENAGK
jgi:hypothetical protein